MSWYKNNPNLYVKYGDWNVKGFFKLCNSTSSEMFSRLNQDIIITESDKGYGKCGYFSIDGGKHVAYIPLDPHSEKDINDIIPIEKCCVVVMNKYGEDDIYRIIENDGVNDIDDSRLGIDIFEHVKLYDTSYKEVSRRLLNSTELFHLNIYLPGVVVDNGQGGYYCKLFAKGSSTQFYAKKVDPLSEVTMNDLFDITKCEVREYKRADSSEIKIMIYIPKEAKDLSRIESLKKQEKETEERQKQIEIKHSISRLEFLVDYEDADIETINKEFQHLCSLIGNDRAAEYKPYVIRAIENVQQRTEDAKQIEEKKQVKRERRRKKIELFVVSGYWFVIWLSALYFYIYGNRDTCKEILTGASWLGPLPLLLVFYLVIYLLFRYEPRSKIAPRLLMLLWVLSIAITVFLIVKQ